MWAIKSSKLVLANWICAIRKPEVYPSEINPKTENILTNFASDAHNYQILHKEHKLNDSGTTVVQANILTKFITSTALSATTASAGAARFLGGMSVKNI